MKKKTLQGYRIEDLHRCYVELLGAGTLYHGIHNSLLEKDHKEAGYIFWKRDTQDPSQEWYDFAPDVEIEEMWRRVPAGASSSSKPYVATFNHGAVEETFYAVDDAHASVVAHEIAARRSLCFDAVKEQESTPPVVCEPRRGCIRD